jgi:histidinol-phosphate aminotransferase
MSETPQPLPVSRRDFQKLLALGIAAAALPAGARLDGEVLPDSSAPIRLHFNENPAGLAPAARRALDDGLFERAWQYPEESRRTLHAKLALFHGIADDALILGNGSSELLAVAAQTFGGPRHPIVVASPTYDAVAQYAGGIGAEVTRVPLGARFAHDLDAMSEKAGERGLLYICNPNNPTGTITPKAEVRRTIEEVPGEVVVIVDEAYHHYVDSDDYESVLPLVASHPNLLVLRTFSKIYGMAGLRCGYGIAQPALVARLRERQARNNLNVAALLAASASLSETRWVEESKKRNNRLRATVFEELGRLGYEATPSEASFFMVDLERDGREIAWELASRGVLVGRSFPPMTDYLRVSIGTEPQMERFLQLFRIICGPRST